MVFEVTDADLEVADKYEPVEYVRVVANLASGGQAQVYVAAEPSSEWYAWHSCMIKWQREHET